MKISKARIRILDTFFAPGNRTLFMMTSLDARYIGFSNNITGDLFIDGQPHGQHTFYKERLIGRKNFDYESYAIIDSKETIDKNKNSKIEIEFHLKSMEKFLPFENPHKYPGLTDQKLNDLLIHYVHFGQALHAICVACYEFEDKVLYKTIEWRPPEDIPHMSFDTMMGTAPYFYANDKYLDRQIIESLLNVFPTDHELVPFLGIRIDGSSSLLSIPRFNIEYDWYVRDETNVIDRWTEKLLEI